MYLVKVVPIDKILRPANDFFLYTSKIYHNYLSLVEIPLRNKKTLGLVLECQKLEKEKLELKKTVDFSLKRILRVINPHQVLDFKFLEIAHQTSQKFALPLGAFLNVFLPKSFLKRGIFSSQVERIFEKRYEDIKSFLSDIDRYKNRQVLIALPDIVSLLLFNDFLKKHNIESLVLIKEKKKLYQENINLVYNFNLTKPILAVGNALLNPFPQISEIVILGEGNHSFEQNFRYPEIDFRIYLEIYAQVMKIPLIVVDWVPSVRFYWKYQNNFQFNQSFANYNFLNYELKKPTLNNLVNILNKKDGSFLIITAKKDHQMILSLRKQTKKSIFYLFRENRQDFLIFENLLKKIKDYILIATPVILKPVLNWHIDYAIFLEPEFFLLNAEPRYRTNENFFRLFNFIRTLTNRVIFLTLKPEKFLEFFQPNQFYQKELEERRKYGLPPFFIQAELNFSAKNESDAEKKYQQISESLSQYFYIKISPLYWEKNQAKATIILNDESLDILKSLPSYVKIKFRYY